MVLSLGLLCFSASAQKTVSDPFAELEAEIKAHEAEGSPEDMKKFHEWKDEYLAEYQKFRVEHFNKLDDIRDKLMSSWGEVEISEQSKYVEYAEDNRTKTVLDFEKNEIRISVLNSPDNENIAELAQSQLNKLIENNNQKASIDQPSVISSLIGGENIITQVKALFEEAIAKPEVVPLEIKPKEILARQSSEIAKQTESQYQVIDKIIDMIESQNENGDVNKVVANNAKIKAEILQVKKQEKERIERLKKKTENLAANSDKRGALANKNITTYVIPLKNKKDTERAKPYFSRVKEESSRFKLKPSVVFAVIHTESYFNPKAQSHVPAYGLMQIVPTTAGVDVNRFLFKKDAPMSAKNLYIANKNIEAGTAYLHILLNRYLRKIDDPTSRLYCAIAAYNTGSGNVAKTFNVDDSRNISKAAKIINTLSPEEVYQQLLSNLPYEETRHYLERVSNRRAIYEFLDET